MVTYPATSWDLSHVPLNRCYWTRQEDWGQHQTSVAYELLWSTKPHSGNNYWESSTLYQQRKQHSFQEQTETKSIKPKPRPRLQLPLKHFIYQFMHDALRTPHMMIHNYRKVIQHRTIFTEYNTDRHQCRIATEIL